MTSPFTDVPAGDWLASNRSAFAVPDAYPVTPGHALVVPRRLISDWWQASADERLDLLALVDEVKALLDAWHEPDGFNIGFNAGTAAGQTVDHLHIHVIPRYDGDVPDPRGGIRHVIPERGNYLGPTVATADSHDTGAELLAGPNRRLLLELLRCLRNEAYDRIDLVVSFIMKSGVALLEDRLERAIDRGAVVRILTTDYMNVTDADALARLLDLAEVAEAPGQLGALDVRLWRAGALSFHPKAYLFWSTTIDAAAGFVGSSNLSRSGIDGGIEWNVGVGVVAPLVAAFEDLWSDDRARPLDHALLHNYREGWQPEKAAVIPIGVEVEAPTQPVAPRPIQREALDALEATRSDGYTAGLVVMATGLGKTWLAAFDSARPQVRRTLFVAHREEILRQSRDVFRQVQPGAELGLYYGGAKHGDADVVFASIQTIAQRLDEFEPDAFDYVVVDEFHHASAPTYRRLLAHFDQSFLLGLTATPERMDGADLLALCSDNLVYECDLVDGIRRQELVPFRYWGVRDVVDFEPIPWRNGRFDPEALTRAVETQERARQALDEWHERGEGRTLAFCCSITHADFMAEFFRSNGVSAVAVHSGPTSAPRQESVNRLRAGDLEVLFSIDVFNEGVDIPEMDCVLMLRPTDSPVVFLQQLGRGLRRADGKDELRVIDFIGNHRSFLLKPRTLLSLGRASTPSTQAVLEAVRESEFELPEGCSVAYDLDVVDLFGQLARARGGGALEEYCLSQAEESGLRPTAMQAFRAGLNPRAGRNRSGHWFGFLNDLGLLTESEQHVVAEVGEVLEGIEKEQITKAYKLTTLRALLHDGVLRTGEEVARISATAQALTLADPRLTADVTSEERPEPSAIGAEEWMDFWRRWPLEHMTTKAGSWFRITGDRFEPTFAVTAELGEAFDAMVAEVVEWRLAAYLLGREATATGAISCRVSHSGGRPMLFLDRKKHPDLPEGESAFIADGEEYIGTFVSVALNTAHRPGEKGNALHALLRGWFGPSAGLPGTRHTVLLEQRDDRWVMRPETIASSATEVVPYYPDLEVACGAFGEPSHRPSEASTVDWVVG